MSRKRSSGETSSSSVSKRRQTDEKREDDFEEWLNGKIINDPIHETIRLHPMCMAIIDTPQFQRLRNIKQLGAGYYVYPGASHNRFEHSIGVAYLAGQFTRKLRENQPKLNITSKDILCAEIAGLCHDLGHGPFSHLFDNMFIPAIKEIKGSTNSTWQHEDTSLMMFDDILKKNPKVQTAKLKYHLGRFDIIFIKEMITGEPLQKGTRKKFQGRESEKWFLYQIVANKKNGIDVDKWDYFARDSYMLGMKDNFSHKRYMEMARVIEVDGERHICMRDKEVINLYDMYHTREALHRRAYQHRVTKGIELMIVDALVKADLDGHFLIPPERKIKLSESIGNMEAYSKLDDSILSVISLTPDPDKKLEASKAIIERIRSRQLYKCVAKLPFEIAEDKEHLQKRIVSTTDGISSEDFVIFKMKIDYGDKDKDPIKRVYFYKKGELDTAIKLPEDKIPKMLPNVFEEKHWVVYSRNPGKDDILEQRLKNLETE